MHKRAGNQVKSWQGHSGFILDSVRGFDVIACETCGFKHIVPIPSLNDIEKKYRDDFYSVEKINYIDKRLGDLEWWNLHYDRIYQFLEGNVIGAKRKILSIGCGPGFFLQRGVKRGWDVVGIEPGREAVRYAKSRGINVIEGFFEEVDISSYAPFDVIHVAEVLEHLTSPQRLISYIYNNLRKGGIVCIVAANDYNRLQILLKERFGFKPWWVVPEEHINYFDLESASALLEREGFKIVHKEVTFPMELFLLMGENYVGNESVGRKVHAMRKNLEMNLLDGEMNDFIKRLYDFFMENRIGREFIVYGERE